MGSGLLIRLLAVGTFAAGGPVALNTAPSTPAIFTGDANGSGPGIGGENTGGNVQGGIGRSESKTVIGDPSAAPKLAPLTPVVPKSPAADAVSRARAQVEAARARAQAAIDDARAKAEAAAAQARQQAEDAQAQSRARSDEARARAEANSSASRSSAYTDND